MAVTVAIEELWQAHQENGDRVARDSIILQYAPLVKHVAGRLCIGLPPVLELEDLTGSGMMGLIRAVEHFEPCRGVPFEAYAITCIRGAILDQLRSLDVISRSARQKSREIEKTMAGLQAELERVPTDREVADRLGLDLDRYQRTLLEVGPSIVSLDSVLSAEGDGEPAGLMACLEDPNSPDPVSLAERRSLLEALTEAVEHLNDREQLLLSLYYKEELTMREISQVMSISESRVCQLHTRTILKLRSLLQMWRRSEG